MRHSFFQHLSPSLPSRNFRVLPARTLSFLLLLSCPCLSAITLLSGYFVPGKSFSPLADQRAFISVAHPEQSVVSFTCPIQISFQKIYHSLKPARLWLKTQSRTGWNWIIRCTFSLKNMLLFVVSEPLRGMKYLMRYLICKQRWRTDCPGQRLVSKNILPMTVLPPGSIPQVLKLICAQTPSNPPANILPRSSLPYN